MMRLQLNEREREVVTALEEQAEREAEEQFNRSDCDLDVAYIDGMSEELLMAREDAIDVLLSYFSYDDAVQYIDDKIRLIYEAQGVEFSL